MTLRYAEGGPARTGQQGQRTRLIEANTAAAAFFAANLAAPQAAPAREFLDRTSAWWPMPSPSAWDSRCPAGTTS